MKHATTWLMIAAITTATTARADTRVFPLAESKLPAELAGSTNEVTAALAQSLDAEVMAAPIDDAATLAGCSADSGTCLEKIARSMKADRLVFGTLARERSGEVTLTLVRFDRGGDRVERTFELEGETPDELAGGVAATVAPLFGGPEPEPAGEAEGAAEPTEEPELRRTGGSVTAGSWALIGAGGFVAVIGAGFLMSASSLANDVNNAPTDTHEDIDRLVELEDRGRFRMRVGEAMLAVGAAAIVIGAVRAVVQSRSSSDPQPDADAVTLSPVLINGGVGVVLSGGLP
ncbi:MAG: hypothetical protein AB7P03_23470 [Kofleriaceae bacterium]